MENRSSIFENEIEPGEYIAAINKHINEDESSNPLRLVQHIPTEVTDIETSHRNKPRQKFDELQFPPPFNPVLRPACSGIKDPEMFYPDKTKKLYADKVKAAEAICAICLVKSDCLDYALKNNATGIWGGLTEDERGKIPRN